MLLAALSALWLGILTSISPCPLATNIAAISYIGRRVGSPRQVLLSGLLYTAGRTLAYVAVAALIVGGLLYKADVAAVLSRYMNRFLGPILILVGIVLLRLVELSFRGFAPGEGTQRRVEAMGAWGAGLLGILFALAFCPVSAALFFGSLITLALQSQSSVLLPTLYGVGTAVPVVAVALVLAFSAQSVGKVFHRLTQFELWARWATGALFVLIGGYFCLAYIYGVL
ncbi:MAG: sulfite exporter TauE/SafE family protein [Planctomycetes bacterium]|nr:sulfite exporter TauE/SafE family protein [Planctomycetota bacterium]